MAERGRSKKKRLGRRRRDRAEAFMAQLEQDPRALENRFKKIAGEDGSCIDGDMVVHRDLINTICRFHKERAGVPVDEPRKVVYAWEISGSTLDGTFAPRLLGVRLEEAEKDGISIPTQRVDLPEPRRHQLGKENSARVALPVDEYRRMTAQRRNEVKHANRDFSFSAMGNDGEQLLHVEQEWIDASSRSDPSAVIPGAKTITNKSGQHVNRFERGKYKVVVTGEILTSDDPKAV